MLFTPTQQRIVADLHERDRAERHGGVRLPDGIRAIAPEVAEKLALFVLQSNARTLVEFGTSHGYSTLHLAAAAARTGGHVHTVDIEAAKTTVARENLDAADLLDRVTLTTADGADFVATLPEPVDFALVDYAIPAFMPAFAPLRAKMRARSVLFADGGEDGTWDDGAGAPLRQALEADGGFAITRLRIGKEHLLAIAT